MGAEQSDGEKPGVNVKLEPAFRRRQRQKRKLLPTVVRRQNQHQQEKKPAGEIAEPENAGSILTIGIQNYSADQQQGEHAYPGAPGVGNQRLSHRANES